MNMSTRPLDEQFWAWVKNDRLVSWVRKALEFHPDLVNIRDSVSFN